MTLQPTGRKAIPDGLYSAEPEERVAALGEVSSDLRESLMAGLPSWPTMSPGSLNAWLVFLGPSPGGSPGGDWYYDALPSIGGPHGGVSEYVDGNNFWDGIREFARTVFPELCPTSAYAATMVSNLTPEQSATGPTGQYMSCAAIQVAEVLGQLIRPRLVIALGGARRYTDRSFRDLPCTREFDCGVLLTSQARAERRWFSLKSYWPSGEPFLYVSPAGIHPSLFHVSKVDTLKFLDLQSKVARTLEV